MPFLRYNDSITASWYLSSSYESHINQTIDKFIDKNHNDFFIDIGANIGLTTIQNYNKFDQNYCFEPNPTVFNILKTNVKICCTDLSKIKLFNVGLGFKEGKFKLNIPRNNFGGAFIKDHNAYSVDTLAKKDGLDSYSSQNYFTENVEIKNADFLKNNVFKNIDLNSKGIIKIDVEGYELQIIDLIVNVIPCNEYVIIFENWMDVPLSKITSIFNSKRSLKYKIFTINHPKIFNRPLPYLNMQLNAVDLNQEIIKGGSDIILQFQK